MSENNLIERTLAEKESVLSDCVPRKRLESFFDEDTFQELGGLITLEREPVELVCGFGLVKGSPVYAFAQGGAIGEKHVYKMKKVYQLALKTTTPLVGFYDSTGLHISQGVRVMDSMGDLLFCQNSLSGVLPQISVIVGACVGTNATLACSADYVIMSKEGRFFSTPPTHYTANEVADWQAVAQAGVAHIISENNHEAIIAARDLIALHPMNYESSLPEVEFSVDSVDAEFLRELSEDIDFIDSLLLVSSVFDSKNHLELLKDFGTGVFAAVETLDGKICGVISTNGGDLTADDCVKIARLVSLWDSFNIPVITFVNTTGLAHLGAASARDFAKLSHVYAQSTIPKIAIITGRAYGAGFISLASRATGSDFTMAWTGALISPLPPQMAVAFLESGRITSSRSRESLENEYIETSASAMNAANEGVIDDVIDPRETREKLVAALKIITSKKEDRPSKKHSNIPF